MTVQANNFVFEFDVKVRYPLDPAVPSREVAVRRTLQLQVPAVDSLDDALAMVQATLQRLVNAEVEKKYRMPIDGVLVDAVHEVKGRGTVIDITLKPPQTVLPGYLLFACSTPERSGPSYWKVLSVERASNSRERYGLVVQPLHDNHVPAALHKPNRPMEPGMLLMVGRQP